MAPAGKKLHHACYPTSLPYPARPVRRGPQPAPVPRPRGEALRGGVPLALLARRDPCRGRPGLVHRGRCRGPAAGPHVLPRARSPGRPPRGPRVVAPLYPTTPRPKAPCTRPRGAPRYLDTPRRRRAVLGRFPWSGATAHQGPRTPDLRPRGDPPHETRCARQPIHRKLPGSLAFSFVLATLKNQGCPRPHAKEKSVVISSSYAITKK